MICLYMPQNISLSSLMETPKKLLVFLVVKQYVAPSPKYGDTHAQNIAVIKRDWGSSSPISL